MSNRKAIYTTLFLLLVLAFILGGIIFYAKNSSDLKVIFFDVGEGDAILISEGNNQILIDGGKNGKTALEKLGKYIPFWDRNIEVIIATHPDADHIGGLVEVAKNYTVGEILQTRTASQSQTFSAWNEIIEGKNIQTLEALKGVTVRFPSEARLEVIYPFFSIQSPEESSQNRNSAVAKLNYQENKFIFTGDLPAEQELELLNNNSDIKANILKVSHHGSKYSTSNEFLRAVSPATAIISVGKNNSYGHPAGEVLERLIKYGVAIYRTDEMGDIIYKCKVQSLKCKMEFD